ncbi:MAG: glycosyltransferase family 9 protein [Candidatus Omnitrophica bacterium]|nr:glycosyltransferase family 9 protein [Candidatus Omnitrophota bacterium]
MTQFPRKILLVRCDRIGDLLLTVPAIDYIREKWRGTSVGANDHSPLQSMLVNVNTAELIRGHPGLQEVITLDKKGIHKGVLGTLRLIFQLRQKKFDACLVFHPTRRVHLILFLAGIPRRVGYPVKWGKRLLTDFIADRRHLSNQHEIENVLDFVDQSPWRERAESRKWKVENGKFWIAQDEKAEQRIEQRLEAAGWMKECFFVVLHPGASDPCKRWPIQRFVETGKQLRQQLNVGIAVIAGSGESPLGMETAKQIPGAVDFSGKTTLLELAALLKRSRLLISNDSGPVHVATAVGTPVLSLFGRDHPGLGPVRWRPLGKKDRYLFKKTGSEAENLSAITVEEVVTAAREMLT